MIDIASSPAWLTCPVVLSLLRSRWSVEWRYGDTSAGEKEVAELKRDEPELYEQLLPERNHERFPAITRALNGKRNVMAWSVRCTSRVKTD